MTEGDKKRPSEGRISESQRYRYIGFEVFPGKAKDLFRSKAEKQKLVDGVLKRRASSETLRDQCTLLEERVSMGEKLVLAIASLAILVALLLPWYSAYMEIVEEAEVAEEVEAADTAILAAADFDSLTLAASTAETMTEDQTSTEPESVEPMAAGLEDTLSGGGPDEAASTFEGEGANEEIITGHTFRKQVVKEYTRLSGFGAFTALGSVGSYVFSSGFVLVISALLMLIFGLLCIALPILNIYGIFVIKGAPDEVALKLKRYLRLNWLPLILVTVVFVLSFLGADYGFESTAMFTSVGQSYGPVVLLNSLSWGIFVAVAASILVAVKGIEI